MATIAAVLIGIATVFLAIRIIAAARRNSGLRYYCDSCSQSLGTGRHRERVCPRCGDYRYYTRKAEEL